MAETEKIPSRGLLEDDPIRLLYFINSPGTPGGVEEHVLALLANLPRDRFDISLVCPTTSYPMFAPLAGPNRRIFSLNLYRSSHTAAMIKLARLIRSLRVEIAHSHQFLATFFLAPIAKACRVPVVVETPHVREAWRQSWWKRSFIVDRLVYKLVDRFVAVSKANGCYLIEQKGCPREKIVQIYNGRDLTFFQCDGEAAALTRAAYGIEKTDRLIVHVGRLTAQKGHRYLLEALPNIKHLVPNVKVLLVGDGELRQSLEQDVASRCLGDTVIFAGFQASVPQFLEAADLVVLPSLFEGLPLTVIEAAAMGRAVVATSVDGTPEAVLDGKTGVLVPPANPDRLAAAIVALLQDDDRRRAMGDAARRLAEERFGLGQHVAQHAELYESLVRQPAAGSSKGRP